AGDREAEELRKLREHFVLRQPLAHEARKTADRPHPDQRQTQQTPAQRWTAAARFHRALLAELDVPLLLLDGAGEDAADLLVIDGVDHAVQSHQHEPHAERHLQADVLLEAAGHHSRAEEPHHAVRRRGRLAEQLEDPDEVLDVLELLDCLAGEEAGGLQVRCPVQPVSALDPCHLAVQELVRHPAEQAPVAIRVQPRSAEIERHLFPREQHVGKVSTCRRAARHLRRRAHRAIAWMNLFIFFRERFPVRAQRHTPDALYNMAQLFGSHGDEVEAAVDLLIRECVMAEIEEILSRTLTYPPLQMLLQILRETDAQRSAEARRLAAPILGDLSGARLWKVRTRLVTTRTRALLAA